MTIQPTAPQHASKWPARLPFYYGWVSVVLAACAMTATLPGRTHGLGLITEQLLADLSLERTAYAQINLACTLLGAGFCLPVGLLSDRCGVRLVLTAVLVLLAGAVLAMTTVTGPLTLFLTLLLVRGLGQSALSVVSIAVVGKWFRRRLGVAMGVFSILLTFGFIAGILSVGAAIGQAGWRAAWAGLGIALLAFAPVAWLLTRDSPVACSLEPDDPPAADPVPRAADGFEQPARGTGDFTLTEALRTPAFWIISGGTASFNVVWSGITLFNESVLAERGFGAATAIEIMAILTGCGLVSNLVAGKLATRDRIGRLLGAGLAILAVALAAFPQIHSLGELRIYAVALGLAGGIVTIVFFAAWGHLFGQTQLGRIQSAAQIAAIMASASGPLLLAECRTRTGSYSSIFTALAVTAGVASLAAFSSRPPQPPHSGHRSPG